MNNNTVKLAIEKTGQSYDALSAELMGMRRAIDELKSQIRTLTPSQENMGMLEKEIFRLRGMLSMLGSHKDEVIRKTTDMVFRSVEGKDLQNKG